MQTTICKGQFDNTMGLSWWLVKVGGVKTVFHGGGTLGQISAFNLYPAARFRLGNFHQLDHGRRADTAKSPKIRWRSSSAIESRSPRKSRCPSSSSANTLGRYIGQLDDAFVTSVKAA